MFIQKPLLRMCCFCVPLKYGLLAWAYIRLVFSILVTGYFLLVLSVIGIFWVLNHASTNIMISLIVCILMLLFFDIVFNFVLIVGCHKKHTTLLRIYFWFGIAYAVVFVMLYAIIIIATKLTTERCSVGPMHRKMNDSWNFIPVFSLICAPVLILHIYLLLMVHSEILRLKQPSSQTQFVNRIAVPTTIKQVDPLPTYNKKSIPFEQPLASTISGSNNEWLYIDNKNFSI